MIEDLKKFLGEFKKLINQENGEYIKHKQREENINKIFSKIKETALLDELQKLRLVAIVLKKKDSKDFTPLLSACTNSNQNMVSCIFSKVQECIAIDQNSGNDLAITILKDSNESGFTALMNSVKKPKIIEDFNDFIKSLELSSADKSELVSSMLMHKNKEGLNSLMFSCKNKKGLSTYNLLLLLDIIDNDEVKLSTFGAILQEQDQNGNNALQIAYNQKSFDSIKAIFGIAKQQIADSDQKKEFIKEYLIQTADFVNQILSEESINSDTNNKIIEGVSKCLELDIKETKIYLRGLELEKSTKVFLGQIVTEGSNKSEKRKPEGGRAHNFFSTKRKKPDMDPLSAIKQVGVEQLNNKPNQNNIVG